MGHGKGIMRVKEGGRVSIPMNTTRREFALINSWRVGQSSIARWVVGLNAYFARSAFTNTASKSEISIAEMRC